MAQPPWLKSLCGSFKAHRTGRTGWFLQEHRDRLRIVSAELPPRPGEPSESVATRRAFTLATPPGPATAAAALTEACAVFDAVLAGTWEWPDPEATPAGDDPGHLHPEHLQRLLQQLEARLVGEQMAPRTWERTWSPYLSRLVATAGERRWADDETFLAAFLRGWEPNSRSRQMAYDRGRRLWKEAGWSWPEELATLRGSGKAAADPRGVRALTDQEIQQLREAIEGSKLTAVDLVAWDALIVFGLRPQELIGLELKGAAGGQPVAVVSRSKVSSKGATRPRQVPAVPPAGWPLDCFGLLGRWREHGLPSWSQTAASPGERMTKQLRRLRMPEDVSSYATRHAFALRLGLDLGLHVREAAELMGHSPAVHLATYGRRLDGPALQSKVSELVKLRAGK
ncbi:hypothetical protein [Cyanobium sp. N5-Cardenillas]|uniref:hypothetical protein n=1 Tax=Cyanobium sp. N5-Cardenillas TaxID=2823720 RepID=UPI0020CEFB3B|nr:hypothetical protein [Cyanobium sp. N5-Cardenillas]MCP9786793.1 hypothetical protein [Cyanobium sp. N5-Cardenillas]